MKVAIFAYETRDLNTYPSIINSIKIFSESGHKVTVFIPQKMATELKIPNIQFVVHQTQDQYLYVQQTIDYIRHSAQKFNLAIAFYFEGLIVTSQLSSQYNYQLPTIFHSHEIIYQRQLKLNQANLKSFKFQFLFKVADMLGINKPNPDFSFLAKLQNFIFFHWTRFKYSFIFVESWKYLNSQAKNLIPFCIVQDPFRAKALYQDLPFLPSKHFLVPNSYIGFNNSAANWAYKNFNIPSNKKILLYSGGFEAGFDLGLIEAAKNLDDQYLLFLNVFSRDGYLDKSRHKFKELIDKQKLVINTQNLDPDDYEKLVRDSYIGIAWYPRISQADKNMYWLGWSSGKLTKFLSCGKPVIAPSYYFKFKNKIEKNKLGYVVDTVKEITTAVNKIETNYVQLQDHIQHFYKNNLEYKLNYQKVLNELKNY